FVLGSPILLIFILVFRGILPGNVSALDESAGFFPLFITMFFGAGLMEELLKALPVFLFLWLGYQMPSPRRERVGVREPLDGILLGSASAVGFTLFETLGQYVPGMVDNVTSLLGEGLLGLGIGYLAGLQLLIPRILGSIAGHMAYSGYFGYFIGLTVIYPQQRWKILAVGYLTSSTLHALWNATGNSLIILAIVGVLSYAFLTSAILKAKELSNPYRVL
ncbi:MAG: PrsW family intramembrane metalloprotease, partial [Cyanobacteriota bacterium]|nr:PrsW family intramembrane metalloprotease [Cyanobacteriota bacterium]